MAIIDNRKRREGVVGPVSTDTFSSPASVSPVLPDPFESKARGVAAKAVKLAGQRQAPPIIGDLQGQGARRMIGQPLKPVNWYPSMGDVLNSDVTIRTGSEGEDWEKLGGLRGAGRSVGSDFATAGSGLASLGRGLWTGSTTPQPGMNLSPSLPEPAPLDSPSRESRIAPKMPTGVFVGGKEWAPGMDTRPDPALIRGSDSERWLGMTNEEQAANPDVLEGLRRETGGRGRQFIGSASATVNGRPTGLGMGRINAPDEVSPGGGRLLGVYRPEDAPAAQPGYRGQTMNEAIGGRTARERVAALASRASSALGSPSEMELSREAMTNALNIEAQRNAREDRNVNNMLASQERVAGLQSKDKAEERAMQERIASIKDGMTPSEADVFTSRLASFDTEIADLKAVLPKAQGEGMFNLRDAPEEKLITDRLAIVKADRDRLLGIGGDHGNTLADRASQARDDYVERKKLSADQAKAILKEAGGDPVKATAIAKQRGFDTRS